MPTPGRGTGYQPAPDPIKYLRQAYHGATDSIVPQEWSDSLANAIDEPALDRAPWEAQLRGFGAGAVQGLRDQLNPLNIALSAVPGYRAARGAGSIASAGRSVAGAGRAARSLESAAGPTMDVIESAPIKQIMPAMDDVEALTGDLARNLAKIRPRTAAPPAGAGRLPAEFAGVGEETAYNAATQGGARLGNYGDQFYRELMTRLGGRGQ